MASQITAIPTESFPESSWLAGKEAERVRRCVHGVGAVRNAAVCAHVRARVNTGAKPPPGVRKLVVCPR